MQTSRLAAIRHLLPGFVLLLPLLGCASSAQPLPAPIESPPSEALSADRAHALASDSWRRGNHDSTRVYLEQALLLEPRHAESLAWLTRLLYEHGEIEAGLRLLDPALRDWDAPPPEVLVNLAVLTLASGDVVAADSILVACADAHPDYAPARGNLGYLRLQFKDYAGAAQQLEAALDLDPGVAEFENNLGIAYREASRLDDAIAAFARAADLDPTLAEAHFNLALVYKLNLDDDERGRAHFRRYLALGGVPDRDVAQLFQRD
jgi:tetratricopeptide (TPR) repeat protein